MTTIDFHDAHPVEAKPVRVRVVPEVLKTGRYAGVATETRSSAARALMRAAVSALAPVRAVAIPSMSWLGPPLRKAEMQSLVAQRVFFHFSSATFNETFLQVEAVVPVHDNRKSRIAFPVAAESLV